MGYFSLPLLLLASVCTMYSASNNYYDKPLNFRCSRGYRFINRIYSVHNNHHEDRKFSLGCKSIPTSVQNHAIPCYKTEKVNRYDKDMFFMCAPDYYINGMHSVHSNKHEDREWRFTCCHIPDYRLHGCKHSGWTNDYDGVQDFYVQENYVLAGVISKHANQQEDRKFKYTTCRVVDGDGKYVRISK